MDKSFTLEKSKKDKCGISSNVRQSTINFIKQFARAYSFEKKMSISLGGFVANWLLSYLKKSKGCTFKGAPFVSITIVFSQIMKLKFLLLIAIALGLAVVGCNTDFKVTRLVLYPDTIETTPLDTIQISFSMDYTGGDFKDPNLIQPVWDSSAPDVVKVDTLGKIYTLKPGYADITMSCGGASAQCKVTVVDDIRWHLFILRRKKFIISWQINENSISLQAQMNFLWNISMHIISSFTFILRNKRRDFMQ